MIVVILVSEPFRQERQPGKVDAEPGARDHVVDGETDCSGPSTRSRTPLPSSTAFRT